MTKAKKFWNKRASTFDKHDKPDSALRHERYDAIRQYLKLTDLVLDFGCATGSLSFHLANYVEHIKGIDISDEMIAIANEKLNALAFRNVEFESVDISEDSSVLEEYDIILAYYILHLVKHPTDTIINLSKRLKKDGLIILETPCLGSANMFQKMMIKNFSKLMGLPHLHAFKAADIQGLLESNGFEIIHTEQLREKTLRNFTVAKKLN